MKKLIIKSNEWYDNLQEGYRLAFFLVVIMGSLIVAQYFMYAKNFILAFPIWVGTFCAWRVGYVFIQWYDWYKNKDKNEEEN